MNPRFLSICTVEVSMAVVSTFSAAAIGIAENSIAAIAISERWSMNEF